MLDLFRLHTKGDKPKGWIWVSLNSSLLREEYMNLLRKQNQKEIALKINKNLNSGLSTIEKHLIRLKIPQEKLELPLPIILNLIKLINKPHLNTNSF